MGTSKCENDINKEQDAIDVMVKKCVKEVRIAEDAKQDEVRKSPRRQGKKGRPAWKIDRCSPHKSRNSRRARRTENMNFLLELVQDDVIEWDLVELMEPGVSAFAELLSQQEKMKFWNDFINHSEEDQNHFLQYQNYGENDAVSETKNAEAGDAVQPASAGKLDGEEQVDDKRCVHPAYSAEECFERINIRLKNLLRKRHMPKGPLEHLEEEITSFFKEWPSSVFISQISSSFDRLLVHALCQYLDLNSHIGFVMSCRGEVMDTTTSEHSHVV